MLRKYYILFSFVLLLGGASVSFAQNADNTTPLRPRAGSQCVDSINVCEQLDKLRIEQNKKEFQTMIERGDEALKISEELEKAVATNPQLNSKERTKLESLEKIVKKIRTELGGDDDDENRDNGSSLEQKAEPSRADASKDVVTAIRSLKESTVQLVLELKKTTRFTISAAAIHTTNAVLRLTRILKF